MKNKAKINAHTFTKHLRGYNYIINREKELKISRSMLDVYAEIDSIYAQFGNCKVTNGYLAGLLCVSSHQVSQMIIKLQKANLITVQISRANARTIEPNTEYMAELLDKADDYFNELRGISKEEEQPEKPEEKPEDLPEDLPEKPMVQPMEQPEKPEEEIVISKKITMPMPVKEVIEQIEQIEEKEEIEVKPLTKEEMDENCNEWICQQIYGISPSERNTVFDFALSAGCWNSNSLQTVIETIGQINGGHGGNAGGGGGGGGAGYVAVSGSTYAYAGFPNGYTAVGGTAGSAGSGSKGSSGAGGCVIVYFS